MVDVEGEQSDAEAEAEREKARAGYRALLRAERAELLRNIGLFVALVLATLGALGAIGWYERWTARPDVIARKKAAREAAEQEEQVRNRGEAIRRELELAKQRAAWEKECADKGLRFAGTIGDQVQCRP